jgi:hypothetical protein
MNNSTIIKKPLSYSEWIETLGYNANDVSQEQYFNYLNSWYIKNKNSYSIASDESDIKKRESYIQLIKDLLHLFNEDEKKDLFLTDIDFNNDEDLIYIIPYLAKKLKQISQLICQKREEVKKTKTKNELIGTYDGFEKIIYEEILKNFTSKPYQWTRIPISPLVNQFPQLSSINEDFYIEIEDLYDTNNYYDSDSTISIENYLDVNELISKEPYQNLTDDQLAALLTSRFLKNISPTPLSQVYNEYLTYNNQLSSEFLYELSNEYSISINNQIAASQKYLGETQYGLTAVKLNEINEADYILDIDFEKGHNWFYWPSGDKGPDPIIVGNFYSPIDINNSNLVLNRTVSGSSHKNSDLLFAIKDNSIEGAWLQGWREVSINDRMSVGLNSYEKTEFIFPWVGFEVDSKNFGFKNYSLNDFDESLYQRLVPELRSKILNQYLNNTLPNSSVNSIYLNQTKLIESGANAEYMSDLADTIIISPTSRVFNVWNETTQGAIQQAFLYKFLKTDIYIKEGLNDILWPIQSFESGFENLTLTLSSDACLPILLDSIEPSKSMVGCIAGRNFDESDVMYKFADGGTNPIEAAWLGSASVANLDQMKNAIQIYDGPAINCAQYIDGPIQPALYTRMESGQYTSFIWMDEDTPADIVFKYHNHAVDCPYGNSYPHDYYSDQEYQNPTPLNEGKLFPLKHNPCTCRSVNYSPIGHEGNRSIDYNSMCDILFADPQGLGESFTTIKWRDTRNLSVNNSPQFSFYKIDGKSDKNVGFGNGKWTTPTGDKMILKTGRRYTYYRTNFRKNSNSELVTPYLLINYPYKNINVNCGYGFKSKIDLVILIDNSRTQTFSIDDVKGWAKTVCEYSLKNNPELQIAIVSFAEVGLVMNYLSTELTDLYLAIDNIFVPEKYPNWKTDISAGLILANNVLFTNHPAGNDCNFGDISKLCSSLDDQIVNQSKIGKITNCPRGDALKKILIFSDGQETINLGTASRYSQFIKSNGVEIIAVDIGYYALIEKLMEEMASPNLFFNLQEYLLYNDVDINRFLINLSSLIVGCFPTTPTWCKAYKEIDGNWVGMNIPSDMVLRPGDQLAYIHKNNTRYLTPENRNSSFSNVGLSFTLNIKLDGWDYYNQVFNLSARGDSYGGKPFWGKILTYSLSSIPLYGGSERIMDEYVMLHQPEVSDIVLSNGCYISYYNKSYKPIRWNQNLSFNCTYNDQRWNKLKIYKTSSNLQKYLNTRNVQDYIMESTNDPSDLYLESYSTLNPTKYVFYLANEPFKYNESLYNINRCDTSYTIFTSGKVLDSLNPHLNLENIFNPTVANICFPSSLITQKQIGLYMSPNNLGVPYYLGRGYTIELDASRVEYLKFLNKDLIFPDPQKYGPRNRGLTKKDQLAPLEITNIDNSWMIYGIDSGRKNGLSKNIQIYQKMTPYQTEFEINSDNEIGLSTSKDNFQFWNPQWTLKNQYPLTIKNEIIVKNYIKREDALLINQGIQDKWRDDIYGNQFGIFKDEYYPTYSKFRMEKMNLTFVTESGIKFRTEK